MASANPVPMRRAASSKPGHRPSSDIASFKKVLSSSKRVLALCGAGLGASSGLDTFRGQGGLWRNYRAENLATMDAFTRDPGLVWLFYSYRRHKALAAEPNKGHFALAELARRMKRGDEEGFVCLTQNVDGLAQRAGHPEGSLKLLHGCLYDIKCADPVCDYRERNNFDDPFHPSIAITSEDDEKLLPAAANETVRTFLPLTLSPAMLSRVGPQVQQAMITFLDPNKSTNTIKKDELPHCPKCTTALLRPDIVWFGEPLPNDTLDEVDRWIGKAPVDLILVIGTTAKVYPAAGYVDVARDAGAKVAVINMDAEGLGSAGGLGKNDWLFLGDAGTILNEILSPLTEEELKV
ncbi:hypothetical protein sscle_04g033450 [Sclerotinia sclerotiorum 1980 UF-70]|uniref:Deacetylase sirtuin-type domain-containing protein n=1 Tax=Sclerotinia sclerotiorum (strain ATCC 18683 / 1980 / Ss-1) TaxID=665079 RepID=A0A1D9Q0W1_SCLS1|nr:hypothetical protein sscle_04g033450 [Sclerotinia sclerotiorum 1980 UF-70]